ncbi:creatininase family protein [Exilibacterium tricleocarpae]|uniref:Creatininase family protein n=1 Tax=Exilibacterium tricleocarpae TaxID=2591008 RepID=A0A545SRS1_9GAMM|nr:creatininase family protein [Exilibacterium tricleocarpae]TQV67659.1 creatininase family protein [Exilibacterium tricleocarpae]
MIYFWEELTTIKISELSSKKPVVILPVGATEQHGPHLPTGVDHFIVDEIIRRTTDLIDFNVLVLPTIKYGKSIEHANYPGTISLGSSTLCSVFRDIARSVKNSGFDKLLVLNGHGGNYNILSSLVRDLSIELNITAVLCDWDSLIPLECECYERKERCYGVHGGQIETSLMLKSHGKLVEKNQIKNFHSKAEKFDKANQVLRYLGPTSIGWKIEDLNSEGAVGNAVKSTESDGESIYMLAVEKLHKLLVELDTLNKGL